MKLKTQKHIALAALLVLLGTSFTYAQQSDAKEEKKYTIENCVNEFNKDKTVETKVGYQYWFADKQFLDGRTLKMSVVAPHKATHPPHRHVEDEFFFILEGTAAFYLEGKVDTVQAYTSLYCPSNYEHGISNVGDTELKYLVIKKYQK
ncbi:MAG: cupin domain-containing protein [Cyclobacteriaceae bacterium]|nr:cupin domain-containing protein [Cyclobacteriaceae bacterium]